MEDKKILTLLLGSPRIGGNTEKIADALAEGAAEKGYEARKVHLAALTLKGCLDCRKCWSTGKPCIQCETRFFRATGSQYREPLARGDQSRRRGAESHRSKHKYKEPPELRRRRLFVFNQLNVWKYCL